MLGIGRLLQLTLLLPLSAWASAQPGLERSVQGISTASLAEWSQNLDQTCSRGACQNSRDALELRAILTDELKKRFLEDTGEAFDSIDLNRWTTLLESRPEAERCRLLRSAFVLSLAARADASQLAWRLFTHEQPLSALTRMGHRPQNGESPVCPDYFFPESDVLQQAITRGERLFLGPILSSDEATARVKALKKRYLSRSPIFRAPAG
ncbi:MAG: hypothetical protein KGQ59_09175 [Bdellovibrionales bacterium]|nr:hypothetical protein [Bdellovibrionales bacterium]